jgi:hypothetical protein
LLYNKYIAILIGFPFKTQLFRKSKDSNIDEENNHGEGQKLFSLLTIKKSQLPD